jgi:hypothetical protein
MTSLYTVQTSEAAVTIGWGHRNAPEQRADAEPYIYREGAATVVLIGGVEIVYDPEERSSDPASETIVTE